MLSDEPTTYFGLAHQVDVLELVRGLNRRTSRTVIMVLRDISLAARYSDVIIAMRDGWIVAQGPPSEVVTPEPVSLSSADAAMIEELPSRAIAIVAGLQRIGCGKGQMAWVSGPCPREARRHGLVEVRRRAALNGRAVLPVPRPGAGPA